MKTTSFILTLLLALIGSALSQEQKPNIIYLMLDEWGYFDTKYLIRNSKEVPLAGNEGTSFYEGKTHAQTEIFKESLSFIKKNHEKPFFCYLPWTPPHGLWGIDENAPSWQLFDISKDIEEKNDLAASEPVILNALIALAKSSHQPIKPGKIYDRNLMAKDHRQAPHHRKPKKK